MESKLEDARRLLLQLEQDKEKFENNDCGLYELCRICDELLFDGRGCNSVVPEVNGMELYYYLHGRLTKMLGLGLTDWPEEDSDGPDIS